MHLRSNSKLSIALLLCAFAGAGAGCQAEAAVQGNVETPPPPPPPPPPDQDGDGILDADDKCAAEKEDGKPPSPNDGCPNNDEDGDGVANASDKCPTEPETVNEFEDEDGCPDKKPLVQLVGTEVRINQKIQFKHDSAAIEAESAPVLEAVGAIMKEHPDIQLVEVSGHASKEGDANHNKALTQKRVDSVVKALGEQGVAKNRLIAQGYGFYCLIDEGTEEANHEKNRRVEFKILQRDGKSTDVTRGCEVAEKAGIKPKAMGAPKPLKETDKKSEKGAEASAAGQTKAGEKKAEAAGGKPAAKKPAPLKDMAAPSMPGPSPTPTPSPK
ncbi:MAG TPA: OmpA family protein [Polyangiaceae bacterium]|nr:OmpA family protein [Polyangiaceae bacterium]